jgi:hypothetical protein
MPDHAESTAGNAENENLEIANNLNIPVWLHATESFYKKLNRVANKCGMPRYEALSRGLDALLREHQVRKSPLNKAIKSPGQSEVFRRTMGQVSRKYWATVSAEEKRLRGQRSARARWKEKASFKPAAES